MKFDITLQEHRISTDLSSQIDVASVLLDEKINQLSDDLSAQDYSISVELHDKIDEVDERLTNHVTYLSSELSTTQRDLVHEISERARNDKELMDNINSVSAISDAKDAVL